MIGSSYASADVSFKDINSKSSLRPVINYGPRVPVEGCKVTYRVCTHDECNGYFATQRGYVNHVEYVHVSDAEYARFISRA